MVSLVPFLRFRIFWMGKSNPDVIFLKNIENGNPVLVGRLHTNIVTVIFHKSVTQFLQPFWKEKRVCLYLIRLLVSVIQIQAKIHVLKDAKNFQLIYKDKTDIDGSSGKIESILEEIGLQATEMRQLLMH